MTGQGEGHHQISMGGTMVALIRSVNNRHLKFSFRASEGLGGLESDIESLVRTQVRRGTVTLNLNWVARPTLDLYQIQPAVLQSYLQQLENFSAQFGVASHVGLTDLLALPGVISEALPQQTLPPEIVQGATSAVKKALESLHEMRSDEGTAMANELIASLQDLDGLLTTIQKRTPEVLNEYRERLRSRVCSAIALATGAGEGVELKDADLIREVALMSDKMDIREEIVRLRSHFEQFERLIHSETSQGRKLDFLMQEMFREANTIGSKASDALIAQRVVDMKSALEQMRELIQNVE